MKTDKAQNEDIRLIRDKISEVLGLYFPEQRISELMYGLEKAFQSSQSMHDFGEYLDYIASGNWSKSFTAELAKELTVGETYFFRHHDDLMQIMKQVIHPRLSRRIGRPVRIWSVACSSGEEPYTLAMLLHEAFENSSEAMDTVEIYGTDVNSQRLEKAKEGLYSEWSFRESAALYKTRYFNQEAGSKYRLKSGIRDTVKFTKLNLMDSVWPEPFNQLGFFDLILCRNILIYFSDTTIKTFVDRLKQDLSMGGWLVTSSTEVPLIQSSYLKAVSFPNCVFFQRSSRSEIRDTSSSSPVPSLPSFKLEGLPIERAQKPVVTVNKPPANVDVPVIPDFGQKRLEEDAKSLFDTGHYIAAMGCFERLLYNESLLTTKRRTEFRKYLGHCLAHSGNLDEALPHIEHVCEVDKTDVDSLFMGGSILNEKNRFEDAESFFRKVIFLSPDTVMAHFSLINIYAKLGKYKLQQRAYREALRLLNKMEENQLIKWSDGMTAGHMESIIKSMPIPS